MNHTNLIELTDQQILEKIKSRNILYSSSFISPQKAESHQQFVIEIYKNNLDYIQNHYQDITDMDARFDCFNAACSFSTRIDLIDYVRNMFKIKRVNTYVNFYIQDTILMNACKNNGSVEVIRHLVENYEMDIGQCDRHQKYSLYYACESNPNINVINYLYTIYQNILFNDSVTLNKLSFLLTNKNIGVEELKYMVDKKIIDMNESDTNLQKQEINLLTSIRSGRDDDVIMYIYKNTLFENILTVCQNNIENIRDIIKYIPDKEQINKILDQWYQRHSYWTRTEQRDSRIGYFKDFLKVIESLNPLLLDKKYIEIIKNDPFEKPFDEWIKLVDDLKWAIPIKGSIPIQTIDQNQLPIEIKENKLLFFCNNIPYYGDRKQVYGSILLFQDIQEYLDIDSSDPIQLSGSINQKSMNVYLNSIYRSKVIITSQINLCDIDPGDIFNFIEFIDRYPTNDLSLSNPSIDQELTSYFSTHNIDPTLIKEIIMRYGLKYMYLYAHNYNIKYMEIS